MERERHLEVTQWTPETIIAASIFPVTRRSRISPKLVGLVGTLFLHGLVVQLLILRMREVDAPLPVVTPGSVESLEGRESPLTLIALPAVGSKGKVSVLDSFSPQILLIKAAHISPPNPPAVDIAEESDSVSESAGAPKVGDVAEHARLAGIYSTQVSARIERVWRRPRTRVQEEHAQTPQSATDETFRCQVQIVQNARGEVQEVLLPNCNGSQAWRHSLVQAIN